MQGAAVYAGSFDPPTLAHLDILARVSPLFDKVYMVVAENPRKANLFSSEERKVLLQEALKDRMKSGSFEVQIHDGLIVDFCRRVGARVLIRGLRAVSDFEAEFQMATMNRRLDSTIETLHVVPDEKYYFVSSTLVKELAHHGGPLEDLVPQNVIRSLKQKLGKKKSK